LQPHSLTRVLRVESGGFLSLTTVKAVLFSGDGSAFPRIGAPPSYQQKIAVGASPPLDVTDNNG
jgi:hypothetical protein